MATTVAATGCCAPAGQGRPPRGTAEGTGRPGALVAGGSGLVVGEEVGGEVAAGEGSCDQCDRGRKAASVGNTGLLEGSGCPQPEGDDGRRGGGDTAGVAAGPKAHGEVAEPVQA